MKSPKRDTQTAIELRPDGWERFEKAVDAAVKTPAKRRPAPTPNRKPQSAIDALRDVFPEAASIDFEGDYAVNNGGTAITQTACRVIIELRPSVAGKQ